MIFNEDSRVKIPALLTLSRLGFEYVSLKSLATKTPTTTINTTFSPPPPLARGQKIDLTIPA